MRLVTLTYSTALAIMLGWLLWIGRPLLLPVITAVIVLYVISAASTSLARVPGFARAPSWALRLIVLIGFTVAILSLFFLIITSFTQVASALPGYESNLKELITRAARVVGVEEEPNWRILWDATLGRVDAARLLAPMANSIGSFSVTFFLVVLYASFFFAERADFANKLGIALGGTAQSEHAMALLDRINERVSKYLLVKTTVNLILGAISLAIMLAIGIKFALFWAVLIAVLNYVPYFGSLIGVIFPVLLSLAQSGSVGFAALTLITLSAAQAFVAGIVEPRMMGRAFNLSPVVVLIALAFWGALWGVPGAILSVPLTASLVLVFAEIEETRPVAVLLSARGDV